MATDIFRWLTPIDGREIYLFRTVHEGSETDVHRRSTVSSPKAATLDLWRSDKRDRGKCNANRPSKGTVHDHEKVRLGLLVGTMTALITSSSGAAEIAASIQYDFTQPPSGLSPDFQPREGVSLRYLTIKTIDGFQVHAALWQPAQKRPSDTTLVVMVHGSGGSYQRGPESALGGRLA